MDHFVGFEHLAPGTKKAYINSSKPGSLRYSGSDWHSDYSYLRKPPFYSGLCFTKTPSLGGDTAFASHLVVCMGGDWGDSGDPWAFQ